jgi:hypothetical protein
MVGKPCIPLEPTKKLTGDGMVSFCENVGKFY